MKLPRAGGTRADGHRWDSGIEPRRLGHQPAWRERTEGRLEGRPRRLEIAGCEDASRPPRDTVPGQFAGRRPMPSAFPSTVTPRFRCIAAALPARFALAW